MAVQVHPANVQDNVGAVGVLAHLKHYERLTTIRADGAYRGMVTAYARAHGWALEVIRRQGGPFQVLPKRWVVERTFAWLGRWRRLSKDYVEASVEGLRRHVPEQQGVGAHRHDWADAAETDTLTFLNTL